MLANSELLPSLWFVPFDRAVQYSGATLRAWQRQVTTHLQDNLKELQPEDPLLVFICEAVIDNLLGLDHIKFKASLLTRRYSTTASFLNISQRLESIYGKVASQDYRICAVPVSTFSCHSCIMTCTLYSWNTRMSRMLKGALGHVWRPF